MGFIHDFLRGTSATNGLTYIHRGGGRQKSNVR